MSGYGNGRLQESSENQEVPEHRGGMGRKHDGASQFKTYKIVLTNAYPWNI